MLNSSIKRTVGLDLGTRTLGVAISDPLGYSAQPLQTIRFSENSYTDAISKLKEMISKYDVELFVLGNPKHMNGDESDSSKRSKKFRVRLLKEFGIPVLLWDERLSSVAMNREMINLDYSRAKRKEKIDTMAAMIILRSYLDSK